MTVVTWEDVRTTIVPELRDMALRAGLCAEDWELDGDAVPALVGTVDVSMPRLWVRDWATPEACRLVLLAWIDALAWVAAVRDMTGAEMLNVWCPPRGAVPSPLAAAREVRAM